MHFGDGPRDPKSVDRADLGTSQLQTNRNRGFSFLIRKYGSPRSNLYLPRKFEWMNSFYSSEQFVYFKIPKQLRS